MEKKNETKLNRIRKAVEKFNQDLKSYVEKTGDNQLPDIGSTIIGSYTPLDPIQTIDTENGFVCKYDEMEYNIAVLVDEDGEEYVDGWDMSLFNPYDTLKAAMEYDRRRMRKGIRIFESENPDVEESRDDDDE